MRLVGDVEQTGKIKGSAKHTFPRAFTSSQCARRTQ